MHGHAIGRARPGMCGIMAGCPSRPESTRCACGISLGLVRGRCSGRGPSVGRVMRPDAGPRAGVRARRRADPLEAPVRGALCPARGRHARTPADAPNRGAPDQPPGRAGGAARRAAQNVRFDQFCPGALCRGELCKMWVAFCGTRMRGREGADGGGARRRAIVASPAAARRGQQPGPSAAA